MVMRVVGIDHLVIRVGDYETSKAFYERLFGFFGFKVLDEYADAKGWTNGKTRFWICQADHRQPRGRVLRRLVRRDLPRP